MLQRVIRLPELVAIGAEAWKRAWVPWRGVGCPSWCSVGVWTTLDPSERWYALRHGEAMLFMWSVPGTLWTDRDGVASIEVVDSEHLWMTRLHERRAVPR